MNVFWGKNIKYLVECWRWGSRTVNTLCLPWRWRMAERPACLTRNHTKNISLSCRKYCTRTIYLNLNIFAESRWWGRPCCPLLCCPALAGSPKVGPWSGGRKTNDAKIIKMKIEKIIAPKQTINKRGRRLNEKQTWL